MTDDTSPKLELAFYANCPRCSARRLIVPEDLYDRIQCGTCLNSFVVDGDELRDVIAGMIPLIEDIERKRNS